MGHPSLCCFTQWVLIGSSVFDLSGILLLLAGQQTWASHSSPLKGLTFLRLCLETATFKKGGRETSLSLFIISFSFHIPRLITGSVSSLEPVQAKREWLPALNFSNVHRNEKLT